MARDPDKMVIFDGEFGSWDPTDPWGHARGEAPVYVPDFPLLERLLTIAVEAGGADDSEKGVFPKAIDVWLSAELRRAGFTDDEVWPRLAQPRVLPREVAILIQNLPTRMRGFKGFNLREEIARRVKDLAAITPADASILGRAYDKQVDVVISRWDRGPEVLVSTKAQLSSFLKNLQNRYEEAYGDQANLRARHPLASTGFFFVQRATILTAEPDAFERTVDMMRKLQAEGEGPGYTATGLLLVDWDDSASSRTVTARLDEVPDDLRPDQFIQKIVQHALRVTPVTHHVRSRELFERRALAVAEADPGDEVMAEVGSEPGAATSDEVLFPVDEDPASS